MHDINPLGQPVGIALPDWQGARRPGRRTLAGRLCRLEPLTPTRHAAQLFAAYADDTAGAMWTYLPYGPFTSLDAYSSWMQAQCQGDDPLFFAIIDQRSGQAVGTAAYLRIEPEQGCIEVGHLAFSPRLQRQPIATEAMWLMMREAFALGYRRYEWKCHTLNQASRAAAQRLGFSFEGVFRHARVIKGRNRDTAWFSIIDSEWPVLDAALQRWLSADNFDAAGRQLVALSDMTRPLLHHA